MSLLTDLLPVHAEALLEIRGDRYRYVRAANGATAELTLVPAQTEHETRTTDGVVVATRVDDFLVTIAPFRDAFGATTVPEDDDRIVDLASGGHVYRVKPIAGEPCYRTQPGGVMFRVHTKDEGIAT